MFHSVKLPAGIARRVARSRRGRSLAGRSRVTPPRRGVRMIRVATLAATPPALQSMLRPRKRLAGNELDLCFAAQSAGRRCTACARPSGIGAEASSETSLCKTKPRRARRHESTALEHDRKGGQRSTQGAAHARLSLGHAANRRRTTRRGVQTTLRGPLLGLARAGPAVNHHEPCAGHSKPSFAWAQHSGQPAARSAGASRSIRAAPPRSPRRRLQTAMPVQRPGLESAMLTYAPPHTDFHAPATWLGESRRASDMLRNLYSTPPPCPAGRR